MSIRVGDDVMGAWELWDEWPDELDSPPLPVEVVGDDPEDGGDSSSAEEWVADLLRTVVTSLVDPAALSDYDRVLFVKGCRRAVSSLQARMYWGMVAVAEAHHRISDDLEFVHEAARTGRGGPSQSGEW